MRSHDPKIDLLRLAFQDIAKPSKSFLLLDSGISRC
jgi:hypothetical protein